MTDELVKGLAEFKRYQYADDGSLMNKLVEDGQDPKYFIISCIDSRTNPGTIFRAQPGAFFAHKAMGAIVRPYKTGTALAAALQFALNYNKVDTIIVLGHTQCGAVQALVNGLEDPEISSFIGVAQHALQAAKKTCACEGEIQGQTEQNVVLESVENLKEYPSVKAALADGRVTIKPWLFDIRVGDLLEYDEVSKDFKVINVELDPMEDRRQNA